MQIYWTLKSVPELSGLPLKERMRVWRDAHREMTRRSGLHYVSLVGIFAVCIFGGDALIGHDPLGSLIGLIVGILIHTNISLRLARPYIRATLLHQNAYLSDERAEERRHRPISGQELLTAALVVGVLVPLILLVSYAHDALRGISGTSP
jgi:hypothetical protein